MTSQREKRHYIKAERYDGFGCVDIYLAKFQSTATYNGLAEYDKAAHLRNSLVGNAALLLRGSADATYRQLVEKLQRRFGTPHQKTKFRMELRSRRRQQVESLQTLACDIERLVYVAYTDATPKLCDKLGCDAFIDSLGNPPLQLKVSEKEPNTLSETLLVAMKLDIFRQAMWSNNDSRRGNQTRATTIENEGQAGKEGKSTPTKPAGKQHGNKYSPFLRQKATSAGFHQSISNLLERQSKDIQRLINELTHLSQVSLRSQPRPSSGTYRRRPRRCPVHRGGIARLRHPLLHRRSRSRRYLSSYRCRPIHRLEYTSGTKVRRSSAPWRRSRVRRLWDLKPRLSQHRGRRLPSTSTSVNRHPTCVSGSTIQCRLRQLHILCGRPAESRRTSPQSPVTSVVSRATSKERVQNGVTESTSQTTFVTQRRT